MHRDRRLFAFIWLATTAVVAAAVLLVYHCVTRADSLAGRHDAADLYRDPSLLFTDPGILGSAVRATGDRGGAGLHGRRRLRVPRPGRHQGTGRPPEPAEDGYGIAAGPAVPRPLLGAGGPDGTEQAGYEEALYGSALAAAGDAGAGCAAVGRAALDGALAALEAMPYSLEQLAADAAADPAWTAGLEAWSACMAQRGYTAASPEELIAAQVAALATASGDAARALADSEREMAAADFACRETTLDPALAQVAAALAPSFVERNRTQLEVLIPPSGASAAVTTATTPTTATTEPLGTGDVQVTLRWHSTVDLDLSVIDPYGNQIDYVTEISPSGGELDRDANYPCDTATVTPVENVFWPPGGAPAGHYTVTVTHRGTCGTPGPEAFELLILLDGEVVQHLQQAVEPGTPLTVEFDYPRQK